MSPKFVEKSVLHTAAKYGVKSYSFAVRQRGVTFLHESAILHVRVYSRTTKITSFSVQITVTFSPQVDKNFLLGIFVQEKL